MKIYMTSAVSVVDARCIASARIAASGGSARRSAAAVAATASVHAVAHAAVARWNARRAIATAPSAGAAARFRRARVESVIENRYREKSR